MGEMNNSTSYSRFYSDWTAKSLKRRKKALFSLHRVKPGAPDKLCDSGNYTFVRSLLQLKWKSLFEKHIKPPSMQINEEKCCSQRIKTCQTAWKEKGRMTQKACGYLFCIFYSWAEAWNFLIHSVSSPLSAGFLLFLSMCDLMQSNRKDLIH